ncbi:hypothetical protein D3C72_1674570 [compost metagenome]
MPERQPELRLDVLGILRHHRGIGRDHLLGVARVQLGDLLERGPALLETRGPRQAHRHVEVHARILWSRLHALAQDLQLGLRGIRRHGRKGQKGNPQGQE